MGGREEKKQKWEGKRDTGREGGRKEGGREGERREKGRE